ncbi:MAG: phosphate ABC transporter permease PstA [Clostridia bacterium]
MNNKNRFQQKIAFGFLWSAAILTVIILAAVLGYIMYRGLGKISWDFLTTVPKKMGQEGGILTPLIGTLYFVVLTIIIATPIGVGTAIYFTEYMKDGKLMGIIRFSTEALAGVPSIVFGLFGFAFFVTLLKPITGGWSIISGALTAAIMILPTIIRTSEEALKTVPRSYKEGSLALGASHFYTIRKVVLPNALPGILTGILLSIGRAVGETAALLLTLGGSLRVVHSIFSPTRTLAMHLYLVAMEVGDFDMAFASGAVLIILILFINFLANLVIKSFKKA